MKTPFLGPAYRSRSKNYADSLCINLYAEIGETKTGKGVGAFYQTPGLDLLATIGTGPVRAQHLTGSTLYVVSGASVYAVASDYTAMLVGTLPTSTGHCQIIDNGHQTLIVDGNVQQTITVANPTSPGSGGTDGTYPLPLPAPSVGGSQALGTFTISGGAVTDAEITFGGSNYQSNFTITNAQLAAVPGVGALVGAVISVEVGGGVAFLIGPEYQLTAVSVVSNGGTSGASYAPGDVITLAGGTFTQAAQITIATTKLASGTSGGSQPGSHSVTGFTIISPTGYVPNKSQNVLASGGTGTGAFFTARTNSLGTVFLTILTGGSNYTVGDTLMLDTTELLGQPVVLTVTQVNSTSIAGGGTGGTPGPVVLTGTTGTGTKFQINGTINSSGQLESLGTVVNTGSYTVNPTDLTAEPVTGGGLTGATIGIVMAAATATVTTPGAYINQPTLLTQFSTTGVGLGATWTPTFTQISGGAPIFSQVSLPFPGASTATYQDGFGLINQLGTNTVWQSNILDLSVWDPLNFNTEDANPDNVVSLFDVRREVWVIKEYHTAIWINAGLTGFAFQRLDGVYIETGSQAPASVAKVAESLIWLTQSTEGLNRVVMTSGYNLVTISTFALQYAIDQYPTTADAFAYTYQQEGHTFYVLTFPSGNATWVYDVSASQQLGIPMWHQRAAFSNGLFSRHQGNCYVLFNGKNIIGDYQNGNLYALNLDAESDNGQQRKWVRSWRALQQPTFQPMRFPALQIDMQTGIGVPDGTNPQVVLQWSDDGGHNWSDEQIRSAGQVGETALRVKFNRIGSTRRNSGLDRIFKLSSTDAFSVALIGAELLEQ